MIALVYIFVESGEVETIYSQYLCVERLYMLIFIIYSIKYELF